MLQTSLIWGRYEHAKFQNNKSPNFKTPIWESREKMSFECNPYEESQSIL
jgi:hypothetical protein